MDVLLSAVVSDLVGRLFSFLIKKYQEHGATDTVVRLQQAVLRARVVVEEADGRHIANRAMLQQLNQLRQELCRATYALDAFRWRAIKLYGTSHVRASQFGSHTRPPSRSYCVDDTLSVMVENMEATLSDMRELVLLLGGRPRVIRQPYSSYLFMETCMFGRQMEREKVTSFLLLGPSQDLEVLPIIGRHEVGKRTLVEHVCLDDRVRERFTKIHRFRSDELDDLHSHDYEHHHRSLFDFTAKSLIVINMVDSDTDAEESWKRFRSAVRRHAHGGSKIIVISRMEAHASLGTVPPLRLHPPRREELWYFFKNLAFGGADPDERPDLVRIAMELCAGISEFAPFVVANIIAASLRADISPRSWHRVRKMGAKAIMLRPDATGDAFDEYKAGRYYPCRPLRDPGVPCMFYNRRKLIGVARNKLPKVTMWELIAGSSVLLPAGETQFEMLVWQSRVPPYVSYVTTCNMERARQLLTAGEKRARKRRRDQHDNNQRRFV